MINVKNLTKTFKKEASTLTVLENLNFEIAEYEIVSILGPSGCGKSTLLRILAGLDQDFTGEALVNGQLITGPSIEKGMIFQEPRLFPWLNVKENIVANLNGKTVANRKKIQELIDLVKLAGFEESYPKEISGGMAQRVAIARALAREPQVLFLDEPFGALDAFTRKHLQDSLLEIYQQRKMTLVIVTHDIDEAIYLSDRIIVMDARPGTIKKIIPITSSQPRRKTDNTFVGYQKEILTLVN